MEQTERALQAELEQLEWDRGVESRHQLAGIGNHDEAVGHGGDDLLARVRGATTLDEPEVRSDLVGTVNREIKPIDLGGILNR